MVSRPVGDILVSHGVSVTYGCRNIETAQRLAAQVGEGASAVALDVKSKEKLEQALRNVDLVVRYFSNQWLILSQKKLMIPQPCAPSGS